MRTSIGFAVAIAAVSSIGLAQTPTPRDTITYISGGVIYASIGSSSGVADSSRLLVLTNGDTIAVLRVFAVSSHSSASHLEKSSRKLRVGDPVVLAEERGAAQREVPEKHPTPPLVQKTTQPPGPAAVDSTLRRPAVPAFLTLSGRLGAQFYTSGYSGSAQRITQPGVIFDVRGTFANPDFKFTMSGNVRSTVYGNLNPFSSASTNRTRIYRMSLDYFDGSNGVSLGRVIPAAAPLIGYVDGLLLSRAFGGFTAGIAGGFEPDFYQRTVSSDFRKFAIFTSYQAGTPLQFNGSLAYARTYMHTALDREVMSGSVFSFPMRDLTFTAQSEVDFRRKAGDILELKPALTSLFANVSYRVTDFLSAGAGMTAFRPYYSFSTVVGIPDSLLDRTLQSGASLSANLFLPGGVSLFNSYTPRSSVDGFGKEYLNNAAVSVSNLFGRGITVRGTTTSNKTAGTRTTGFGGSVQSSILSIVAWTLRYQEYRYAIRQTEQITNSHSLGADLNVFLGRSLAMWGTVERFTGFGAGGYSVIGEIDWRF